MEASLTIRDFFTIILFLLGIGVLAYLMMILSKINNMLKQLGGVVSNNLDELDTTIKQIPDISYNVNQITKEANTIVRSLSPELEGLMRNANSISGTVSNLTTDVYSSTSKVTGLIDDTSSKIIEATNHFHSGSKGVGGQVEKIMQIIDIVRNVLFK